MEPNLTGYVNVNAGFLGNAAKNIMTVSAVQLGANAESNGYYVQAEGGYGKVVCAKAEVGKEFHLGNSDMYINTSVGGRYTISNKTRNYYRNVFDYGANSPTWKSNDTRGYGQVALTVKNPTSKTSLGIQGG